MKELENLRNIAKQTNISCANCKNSQSTKGKLKDHLDNELLICRAGGYYVEGQEENIVLKRQTDFCNLFRK